MLESTGLQERTSSCHREGQRRPFAQRSEQEAVNPDRQEERARKQFGTDKPTEQQIQQAAAVLMQEAAKPFQDPKWRELLIEIKKKNELVIDHVS